MLIASTDNRIGETLRATIRLIVKRRVVIAGLSAEWVGQEEARFGSGEYTAQTKYRSPGGGTSVTGRRTLEAGEHEFPVEILIPSNASPSYSGRRCSTRHMLNIHLRIPWWIDRKSSFEIPVVLAQGAERYPGESMVFASRAGGPQAKKPYVEGSLAMDVVAPGDVLRGAVALLNTEHNRYTRVAVSLIGTEYLTDRRRHEHREAHRLSVDIETPHPSEGASFPFALRLPETLAASAQASLWSLRWSFQVVARVRLGRDESLSVPLTIAPAHLRSSAPLQLQAPRVGSARQRAIWEAVASAHGLAYEGASMRAVIGEVHLEISRQHRGRAGWSLVARLTFSSLRLGVSIEQSSLLRGTSFGGMKLIEGAWDRKHFVTARSPVQAEGFLQALTPGLGSFGQVTMDDEHIELERSDSGLRRRRLNDFVVAARTVADSMAWARAAMSPPPEFEEGADAWREFAASLGSAIEPGDMSIQGSYQGLRVVIGHRWSEGALSARGVVHSASNVAFVDLARQDAEDCFAARASGEDGIDEADVAALEVDERQRELLRPALLGATRFFSEREQDRLEFPPRVDASDVKARLTALSRFSRQRGNAAGPYR